MRTRILLASTSTSKLRELTAVLSPLGIGVLSPADLPGGAARLPVVHEDAPDFAGNAALKASSAARASGHWALADDSGLAVDELGGEPGVRSARYAGEPRDDARNNRRLLARLADVPDDERGARFVCALALARPDGSVALAVEAQARGRIARAPRGASGFGYDPLFECTEAGTPQSGRTFAELSASEKEEVSHRGRAVRALVARLPELASELGHVTVEGHA